MPHARGGAARCGIATLEGETRLFEAETDTHGLCFAPAGGGGWFVEGSLKGRPMGAVVRAFGPDGAPGEPVWQDAHTCALLLEPSPQGTHLALLTLSEADARKGMRVRVLTLADGKLVQSEAQLRTDDHFMKPRLRWTTDGKAVLLTTRGEQGKWPADVVRCDAASGKLTRLVTAGPWAITGVREDGKVGLFDRQGGKVALLDADSGALQEVAWPVVVLQQAKGRSLLFQLEPRGLCVD